MKPKSEIVLTCAHFEGIDGICCTSCHQHVEDHGYGLMQPDYPGERKDVRLEVCCQMYTELLEGDFLRKMLAEALLTWRRAS